MLLVNDTYSKVLRKNLKNNTTILSVDYMRLLKGVFFNPWQIFPEMKLKDRLICDLLVVGVLNVRLRKLL